MRIGINISLLTGADCGIKTYLSNITGSLQKIDKDNAYIFFKSPFLRAAYEHTVMPFQINSSGLDIFHNPDHILPILPVTPKTIITIHDLAFIKMPEVFSAKKRYYKNFITSFAVKKADHIIAVSENTKRDIMELFKVDNRKITVIYNGVNPCFRQISGKDEIAPVKRRYGIDGQFILSVGTIEPRKNITRVISAMKILWGNKKVDHDLILVGKAGWLVKKALGGELPEKVKILDNVTTEDLPKIYNAAEVFVYPSLYEGFGLPLLEAMACGVPAITSGTSSLPEVAGDAALKVDPYNIKELADSITRLLSDAELRVELSKKGLERAKIFSWDKTAMETMEVYRKVHTS